MRNLYAKYTEDDLWLIKESEWVRKLQSIRESQFSLGNGYLGTRGVLEEIPYDSMPGTYICGVYDKLTAQVTEMVNFPNPINFRLTVNGEKLDVVAMDVVRHRRTLNTKKGLLLRHTVYSDSKKKQYDYQSLRFISMHNKNIGVLRIAVTSLDKDCVLDINTGIDTSIWNAGVLTEGRKKHFRVRELGQYRNAGFLVTDTFEKRYTVLFWSGFYYQVNGKKAVFAKENIFKLKLKKGQTVTFTKVFYIKHFNYLKDTRAQKTKTFNEFYKVFHAKFDDILSRHIKAWNKLWKKSDIVVKGTANLQQNLRFNIYHLLIAGHYNNGFSSIGARMLSGEGYRGHIFWDADIFIMPFFLFTFPLYAKNMLLYRYRILDAARKNAKNNGYKGAMYSWESADTGEEETPQWAKDIDGSIIKIYTHKLEHHITADIAYAVYKYYQVTDDGDFMDKYGYEIIFETARFWASRLEYDRRRKKYVINNVIGPDEFHIRVNNNFYTNVMAKWNLITAFKYYQEFKNRNKKTAQKLFRKIDLTAKEAKSWHKLSTLLFVPKISKSKDNIIEQFAGYFKLKDVSLRETDENGIPILPPHVKTDDLSKTQLVKQPDVIMALILLSDVFIDRTKIANYRFYIEKVVHKSSLSAGMHALLASRCYDMHRAYTLFNVSLRADLSNIYGNSREGIHGASLGATWQALVFGFAGVSIKKDMLFISPHLPRSWHSLIFSLLFRGKLIKLEIKSESVKIKVISPKVKALNIGIFNKIYRLRTNKLYSFRKKAKENRRWC